MDANLTLNTYMLLAIALILIITFSIVDGCVFIYRGSIFIITILRSIVMGLKKHDEPWSIEELKRNRVVADIFERA